MQRKRGLPDPQEVSDMLEDLFDRQVRVQGSAFTLPVSQTLVAIYRSEAGSMLGLCIADMPAAIFMGAALSLVPPRVAKAQTNLTEVPENLREDLFEVFNVASSWFIEPDQPSLRLKEVHQPYKNLPDDVRRRIAESTRRLDLTIDIHGYGTGQMSLIPPRAYLTLSGDTLPPMPLLNSDHMQRMAQRRQRLARDPSPCPPPRARRGGTPAG